MDEHRTFERVEALVTWRSAMTASALIAITAAVGPSSGFLNLPGIGRAFVASRAATMAVALVVIGFLIVQRARPRLSVVRVLFLLPAIPVLFMIWFLVPERAAHGLPTELLVREAVASAVYALAAPPEVFLSILPIAAFSMESLLVYWMAPRSYQWAVPRWQPWTSLLYTAGIVSLTLYRAHRQQDEVATIVKSEQSAALQRLTRSYLAVRDLINTPLQTLRIAAHLLAARYPDAGEAIGTIDRAVDRLNELNQVLADEASTVGGLPGTEAFDPLAVLRASRSKPES